MNVATKKLLLDVREAGESILQHTSGKTLSEYSADRFFRRAVEREFETSAKRCDASSNEIRPPLRGFLSCVGSSIFVTGSFMGIIPWTTQSSGGVIETHLPSLFKEVTACLSRHKH